MLYIVPTPIGNLDDITIRGLKVLQNAKIILCEDPRVTNKLLELLKIENKPKLIQLERNHSFNKNEIWKVLNESKIKNKETESVSTIFYSNNTLRFEEDTNIIALVSDAGTPGISDPAFEVLKIAQELGINYTTLPGATAVIPAVVNSNLITKEFLFLGFLPLKKGRMTEWKRIANSETPVVIYESCHRIKKFLEEARSYLSPQTKICINQEISKSHENIWVGCVDQIETYNLVEKGEFVIVIRN
jgi:16S rRNA (cytidine1402-2'-O)-methyltransferase